MEVIYEDYLERTVLGTGTKKEYKKAYFVFRKNTAGSKTLEYFKESNWRKSEPRGVCNLFNGYAADVYDLHDSKKKFGLKLTTVDKTFELYASSEAARDKWLDVLNEDLVNFHRATILESPANAYDIVRLLTGQLHLQITDCAVVLLANRTPNITWRFHTIRRYKSRDGAFILEVGRKAPTGEGVFRFQVPDPNKLFDHLDVALKNRIKQKRNEEMTPVCRSHRASSFDEPSIVSRQMSTQMSTRSESVEERPLPLNPSEYSSLDLNTKPAPNTEANGYDKLFSDRVSNISCVEEPPVFDSSKLIGRQSSKNFTNQKPNSNENYIDMSGMKNEIIKESVAVTKYPEIKPRPIPPTRRSAEIVCTENTTSSSPPRLNNKSRLGTTRDVDLIDLNSYNQCSPAAKSSPPPPCPRESSEYSFLNNNNNNNNNNNKQQQTTLKSTDTNSSYDHLAHSFGNKKSESTTNNPNNRNENCPNVRQSWDDTYDSPKMHVNDVKTVSEQIYCNGEAERNTPLKPVRPARPRRCSDRTNSGEIFPDTVLVLGKCSNQTNSSSHSSSEAFYDTPRGANMPNGHMSIRKVHSLNTDLLHKNENLNKMHHFPPRT